MSRSALLRQALKVVPEHGFSRRALALSASPSLELSDSAVTSLFGRGEEASKTLFKSWLEEARLDMKTALDGRDVKDDRKALYTVLSHRLRYNVPVLEHLPHAFALLSSPASALVPPLRIPIVGFSLSAGLQHVAAIADDACWLLTESSNREMAWYSRRTAVGLVYAAAEIHQLSMPQRSEEFLRGILDASMALPSSVSEVAAFAEYVRRSLLGIYASRT